VCYVKVQDIGRNNIKLCVSRYAHAQGTCLLKCTRSWPHRCWAVIRSVDWQTGCGPERHCPSLQWHSRILQSAHTAYYVVVIIIVIIIITAFMCCHIVRKTAFPNALNSFAVHSLYVWFYKQYQSFSPPDRYTNIKTRYCSQTASSSHTGVFTARYGLDLNVCFSFRLRGYGGFIVGLSPRGLGFCPRSVHVGFVVNRGPVGQVIFPVLPFSPVRTFPPTLHTHLHLQAKPGNVPESNVISEIRGGGGGGALRRKGLSLFDWNCDASRWQSQSLSPWLSRHKWLTKPVTFTEWHQNTWLANRQAWCHSWLRRCLVTGTVCWEYQCRRQE
jgi:hypothetical protein